MKDGHLMLQSQEIDKQVIFVWVTNVCNKKRTPNGRDGYWGMGDIVAGMLSTHDICADHGIKYCIDITRSPLARFVDHIDHHMSYDYDNIQFIERDEVESYIVNNKQQLIPMLNNMMLDKYSDQAKEYVRNVLKPNKQFQDHINQTRKQIGLADDYNVLHIRAGDTYMQKGGSGGLLSEHYEIIMNAVSTRTGNDWLILTDNVNLKREIKQNFPEAIQCSMEKPVHSGLDHTHDNIKQTLTEFYLVCASKSIKNFSAYSWSSNFITQPAMIHNIPVDATLFEQVH